MAGARLQGWRKGGSSKRSEGVPHFIEVNPLAGLHPVHSDLPILSYLAGITYQELIEMILDSAEGRLRSRKASKNACPIRMNFSA